jgi:hypothetical protein
LTLNVLLDIRNYRIMPSQNFSNADKNYESPVKTAVRPDFQYPSQADDFKRRAAENYNYLAGAKAFKQTPREREDNRANEKIYQRSLKQLRKKAPVLAMNVAKGKPKALKAFFGSLYRQIDWSVDWLFILLASFGLLKDLFDIAFAALGAVPVIGVAGAAVGIIISFVGDLMFLILVVTVLVLVGGSLKNRGMAKYFIGMAMEFVAEALPGISLLPWTVIYVFILWFCVLYDRALSGSEKEKVAA